MVTICVLVGFVLAAILLLGWLLALSAKAVGSARGRWRVGLLAAALLFVFNIAMGIAWIAQESKQQDKPAAWMAREPGQQHESSAGLVAEAFAMESIFCFLLLRRVFGLSMTRTLAPFFTVLGFGAVEYGLMVGVVRPHVLELFRIPAASMLPTLEPGDRISTVKILAPRRLDLMVYHRERLDEHLVLCHRVIGLPGERIRFEGGGIYVNDQPLQLPDFLAGHCHANLSGVLAYRGQYRDGQTIALGADEYFVVGDHIDQCIDSRLEGPVKRESLIGVVDVIYWPAKRARIVR